MKQNIKIAATEKVHFIRDNTIIVRKPFDTTTRQNYKKTLLCNLYTYIVSILENKAVTKLNCHLIT